jgi:hypothetical protein
LKYYFEHANIFLKYKNIFKPREHFFELCNILSQISKKNTIFIKILVHKEKIKRRKGETPSKENNGQ